MKLIIAIVPDSTETFDPKNAEGEILPQASIDCEIEPRDLQLSARDFMQQFVEPALPHLSGEVARFLLP